MKITVGGKSIRPDQFADAMMKELAKKAGDELRERFSAMRHPATGEFPTVVIRGETLDDMAIHVEGSSALLDIVREQTKGTDLEGVELRAIDGSKPPRVFLSYAGEDEDLAKRIANALMAAGIDTWFAPWSIAAGDAWLQEINKGIDDCTHFVVLLTPASIGKPWVKTEIDAAFIKRVEQRCKFIALRSNLSVDAIDTLLRTLHAPSIDNFDEAVSQLVSDIHGLSRKPALGPAPAKETAAPGYSLAATKVAEIFVRKSETAVWGDPQMNMPEVVAETGLTAEDVRDALHELRHFFRPVQFDHVIPNETLFPEFDKNFMGWSASDDGLQLATDLFNDLAFPVSPAKIAERYGWNARRLNPAITYLVNRNVISDRKVFGCQPWITPSIIKKPDELRRFVKSRT